MQGTYGSVARMRHSLLAVPEVWSQTFIPKGTKRQLSYINQQPDCYTTVRLLVYSLKNQLVIYIDIALNNLYNAATFLTLKRHYR